MNLTQFLNRKPLFYNEIDLDRMPKAYNSIKYNLKLPNHLIHIVGTNGKGSTGRFLAHYLYKLGYKVGHYTSPHILKFNERIWINGKDIDDETLENNHQKLQTILSDNFKNSLSYFEYTTLLAMISFENCDYVILEAGLGGEFDATNVFPKEISLITTIDFDHQNFLGNSISEIIQTKLNSISETAIIGKQIHKEVWEIATKLNKNIYSYETFFSDRELKEIETFIKEINLASFFKDNLSLAMSYIKYNNLKFDLNLIKDIKLFGRMQEIKKDLFIDVGHNPLAATTIKNEFKNEKIDLIYNTYKDKDYKEILTILKPIIKKLFIIEVQSERIEKKENLIKVAKELDIEIEKFENFNHQNKTLIFGSFSVIEEFLKYEK